MHKPACCLLLLWTPASEERALRVQATPRAEEVAPGGIGSTLAFTEDSRLGPEPMLWSSPGAGRPGAVARNSRVRPWPWPRARVVPAHRLLWVQEAGVFATQGELSIEWPGAVARSGQVPFWPQMHVG